MTRYLVIYERSEDGHWGAYSPDLPGCVAAGSTRAEVERLMPEAVEGHLAQLRASGRDVPQPASFAGYVVS